MLLSFSQFGRLFKDKQRKSILVDVVDVFCRTKYWPKLIRKVLITHSIAIVNLANPDGLEYATRSQLALHIRFVEVHGVG